MKPERTQIAGPFPLNPDRVRFTVGGSTMKPERTQITVDGVVMKPARTQVTIAWDAWHPERFQSAVAQLAAAVRFVGFGNFGQALEAFRTGYLELTDLVSELIQIEIELLPVRGA